MPANTFLRVRPAQVLQVVAAGVLLFAAWQKLSGQPIAVDTFAALRLGQIGRISAGITEILIAVFICLPGLVWAGVLMGISQLSGAILFYVLVLQTALPPGQASGQLSLAMAGLAACIGVLLAKVL